MTDYKFIVGQLVCYDTEIDFWNDDYWRNFLGIVAGFVDCDQGYEYKIYWYDELLQGVTIHSCESGMDIKLVE